jgi:hypothetical protein
MLPSMNSIENPGETPMNQRVLGTHVHKWSGTTRSRLPTEAYLENITNLVTDLTTIHLDNH